MAHEILIEDGHASMFYVDKAPWHGLGTKLEKPPASSADAIAAARLDWEVVKAPLYITGVGRIIPVKDEYAIVRKDHLDRDDCRPFARVGRDFTPLQNRDAFRVFDPLLKTGHVAFETAGALGRGERIWVLARFLGDVKVGPDLLQRFLLLSNSHDGKGSVTLKFTPVRVVCQNTLSAAVAGAGREFRVRHDRHLESRLQETSALFDEIVTTYDRLQAGFESLRRMPVDDAALRGYLNQVFPDPPGDADVAGVGKDRARRDRAAAAFLYRHGRGNQADGVRGTLWAAYNGVTDYVDHRKGNPRARDYGDARLRSVWFGRGAAVKQRALVCALERADPGRLNALTLV